MNSLYDEDLQLMDINGVNDSKYPYETCDLIPPTGFSHYVHDVYSLCRREHHLLVGRHTIHQFRAFKRAPIGVMSKDGAVRKAFGGAHSSAVDDAASFCRFATVVFVQIADEQAIFAYSQTQTTKSVENYQLEKEMQTNRCGRRLIAIAITRTICAPLPKCRQAINFKAKSTQNP